MHTKILVVILIVREDRILVFKLESHTPVTADADCPVIFERAGHGVKAPTWSIHVLGAPGVVEGKQLKAQFLCVLRLNSRF